MYQVPYPFQFIIHKSSFTSHHVRFQVLTATSNKITVFWDITLWSIVLEDRCFRGSYYLHHRPDDGGSRHIWNVGLLQRGYTTRHPRRLSSSCCCWLLRRPCRWRWVVMFHDSRINHVYYHIFTDALSNRLANYSGRKITPSFGNVTVRGEKIWKGQGGSTTAKSLSEHV
jgi:hypothetical protein